MFSFINFTEFSVLLLHLTPDIVMYILLLHQFLDLPKDVNLSEVHIIVILIDNPKARFKMKRSRWLEHQYGLDAVMDLVGYTPTKEFDLVGKLRRDSDALALDLGGKSIDEFAGLENQLMLAMESIQAADANLR
ncbi:hypothetical protein F2Q70_00028719 [Brassica cretica]|uniref:Uncharacterized protein n=1 Tax=Brassica cretica TaxID=69181 RepID=A0A8S9LE12_BRACR|nr:hypothetical protein F2Q70_00028719 [Brassica cretica]KAF3580644.1 hypothetical protein DY000_02035814 [Brassica cretica]